MWNKMKKKKMEQLGKKRTCSGRCKKKVENHAGVVLSYFSNIKLGKRERCAFRYW